MKYIGSLALFSLTFIAVTILPTVMVKKKWPVKMPLLSATCFCKISKDNLVGNKSATGVIKDLTGEVNKTFLWQGSGQQDTCQSLCSTAAEKYEKNQSIAASACAAGAQDFTQIIAYSAVGTMEYRGAREIGTLQHILPVTQTTCTCPSTWYSDMNNVLGGVTTTKCKKLACKPIGIAPLPPNGTPVGSWGFTWGNELWAYGSNANGGAPTCVTVTVYPELCGWR